MKSVVFANIGNRDIGYGLNPIYINSGENILEESRILSENEEEIKKLDAILLEPAINEIKKQSTSMKICLFATLQEPPHRQDTFFIAKIVRDILKMKYGFSEDSIKIQEIEKNPSDYDEMYKIYDDVFEARVFDDVNQIYVSTTGGTPAQNFALLLHSVRKAKNKTIVIYLTKNSIKPTILQIGGDITKSIVRERAEELISKNLFGAAADIADKYSLMEPAKIKHLRAMEERKNFNFEKAIEIWESIRDSSNPEMRKEIDENLRRLNILQNKTFEVLSKDYFERRIILLEELLNSMKIKLENKEYADFLGRVFRFEEEIGRIVIEYYFRVPTDKSPDNNSDKFYKKFGRLKAEDEIFKKILEKSKEKISFLEPTIYNMRTILTYVANKEKHNNFSGLLEIYNSLQGLSSLRNKTIISHGFEGISEEKIIAEHRKGGGSPDILSDCKKQIGLAKSIINNEQGVLHSQQRQDKEEG